VGTTCGMDAPKSDARIDGVKDRLSDDLVDERGNPADPSAVAKVVDEASAPFAEAPVAAGHPAAMRWPAARLVRASRLA